MKRGISPLVATVLIISLVVIITVILVYSLQGLVEDETSEISGSTDARSYCLHGVDLDIETPCEYNPNPSMNNVSIKLKNIKNGDISGFIFKVIEGANTYVYENNLGIPGLGSKRYFLGFSGNYEDINEIVVIPKVATSTGEEATCDEIQLSMNSFNRCCLDLDGDHVDSCNASEPLDEDGLGADCNESDINSWKMWENVYPDEDLDGEFSMFTQVDYCGNNTLDETYPIYYSLSPGDDCVDNNHNDCNEWYNLHTTPNGVFYENECNSFDPYQQRKGTFLIQSPARDDVCFNNIDDDCDGLIDAADLGPICYPTCYHGDMHLASYPCKCETGGVVRTFYSYSSGCPYCCNGDCWTMDCNIVPIET